MIAPEYFKDWLKNWINIDQWNLKNNWHVFVLLEAGSWPQSGNVVNIMMIFCHQHLPGTSASTATFCMCHFLTDLTSKFHVVKSTAISKPWSKLSWWPGAAWAVSVCTVQLAAHLYELVLLSPLPNSSDSRVQTPESSDSSTESSSYF